MSTQRDPEYWMWVPFRDRGDESIHRNGLARWSHTDHVGVQWFELWYDGSDELTLAPDEELDFS